MPRHRPPVFTSHTRSAASALLLIAAAFASAAPCRADEPEPPVAEESPPSDIAHGDTAGPKPETVQRLAELARPSVVIITYTGRDGKREGLGTGFVVSADGLIATKQKKGAPCRVGHHNRVPGLSDPSLPSARPEPALGDNAFLERMVPGDSEKQKQEQP